MQTFNDFLLEKKSPYKKPTLDKYKKKWEKGEKIPFGIEASLKAQGMIPRADGTYEVSDEYKKEGIRPQKKITSFISPETKSPETHADKVEKRIHKAEKEKLHKIEHPEILTSHPDSSHKGNPKDVDFEGIVKTPKGGKKQKSFKSVKKKLKKYYNPKSKISEGTIPSFTEVIDDAYELVDNIPSFNEFKHIS